MRWPLRWQIVWAPAVALAVAGLLLVAETQAQKALASRLEAITLFQQSLNRALARLEDRHTRTVRRASEASLEEKRENRIAVLSQASEHYLSEMERFAGDARAVLNEARLPSADPRFASDKERLLAQLDRVMEQAHAVAPSLDALLSAVASDDPDATLSATQELARADRAMQSVLRTTSAMAERTVTWQHDRAIEAQSQIPGLAWLLLLVFAPLSLFIAQRPATRLAHLAAAPQPSVEPSSTREEALIAERLHDLASREAGLDAQVASLTRESERAEQSSRRAEHELALLRIYSENLTNSLRSAVIVTDAALLIRSWNRMARVLLGLDDAARDTAMSEQLLYRTLMERTRELPLDLARALGERVVLRFDNVSFQSSVLDLTIAPYLDEGGAARGLLFIADDVTEAVRVKGQLLQAERLAAVGRLSAQVAHEIRNPLSAIGLNAELLEEDLQGELEGDKRAAATALLRGITSEIERLTHVTEGYLQLTRLPHPQVSDTDVNVVVTDLAALLREELRAASVELVLDLASPPPRAPVDGAQLRQALLNIVRNAREAMASGGTLTLRTRVRDGVLEIEVRDTGAGIPAEVLPRIFEPFFTTKPTGTGLGLSLTRQIIAEHGGTIRAESHPAQGTTMTIRIPVNSEKP